MSLAVSASAADKELSACECPVCFSLLVGARIPMSLSCGHTLCKVCIAELGVGGRQASFPCPICRKSINVGSVTVNVTLRNLIG